MRLTKEAIEKAKLPEAGRRERFIRDDMVRGLGVRVVASGERSFIFEARIKGRPRRLTIGRWPDLNVAQARERAHEIRVRIAKGEDPATEAREARKEATFGELCDAYMERHAKPHKRPRSVAEDQSNLRRYVPLGWKSRKLSDFSREDIARLHAKIGADHSHYAANRTLALLCTMFNLARDWKLLKGPDNPAHGIKKFKEAPRSRYLSPAELARLNTALLAEKGRWRAYFSLLVLLGTRRTELLSMRWVDIDFAERTWRIPETKNGNSHLLPLPAPAIAILNDLPSRGGEWVFPAVSGTGHICDPSYAWERIKKRAGIAHCRIHDLRHSLASLLVAQGFNLPLIGKVLNHSSPAITARYAHLALDPVRAALETTAQLMMASNGAADEHHQPANQQRSLSE